MFTLFSAKKNSAAKMAITLIATFSLVLPQISSVYAATVSVTASSSSSSEAYADDSGSSASSESESEVSVEIEADEDEEVSVDAEASSSSEAHAETNETEAHSQSESFASVSVTSNGNGSDHKIVICHATSSTTNPYNEIEVDKNAWDTHSSAHSDHENDFVLGDDETECPDGDDDPTFASAMCSAQVTVEAGDEATWTAEISGNPSDFSFVWEGTEDLSGTSVSVVKEYSSAGTKMAEVTVTATDEATTSVDCSISVEVDGGNDPEPEPEDEGSIRICKMIVNEDDEIQTSSANLITGSFSVKLAETADIDNSLVETVTFDASAFTPNASFVLDGQDAECVTIDGLDETEDYFYSEESISGDYTIVGYNDQFEVSVMDLDDFFGYKSVEGEENSDGHITLKASRPHRTLILLNSFEEVDEPREPNETMCVAPISGDDDDIVVQDGPKKPLQSVLDDYGYSIDVQDDQKDYESWTLNKDTTTVTIKLLDKIAGADNVFGYYVDGDISTFTPVFKVGDHSGFGGVPTFADGESVTLEIDHKGQIGFAISSENGAMVNVFATEDSLNGDSYDHVVAYDGVNNGEYILGFEDLPENNSDDDYNDMIVEITVEDCEDDDTPPPTPTDEGTLRICKVLLNENGDITAGNSIDATFEITVTGPNSFEKTATFTTPLNYTIDHLTENDDDADIACVEFTDLPAGEYLYGEETISSTELFKTPKYNDQFNETVKDLLDFHLLTVDGSEDDNDNADGVINLPENKTRELIILNQVSKDDEGDTQCSDGIDNEDNDSGLIDENDPGCHTDGDPDNPDSYDPNDDDETDPLPTVDLKLNDTDGTVGVEVDETFTLSWTSEHAVVCTASIGWTGDKAVDGSEDTSVASDTTFTITCENGEGETAHDSVTADIDEGNGGGDDPQCSDNVDNEDGDDLADENDPGCHTDGDPDNPDSYDPEDDDETDPSPTVDLKLNGNDGTVGVDSGVEFTLSWTSTNAVVCTASNGWTGDKALNDSENDSVTTDTTYEIECVNGDGEVATDSVTADIQEGNGGGNDDPTVDIKINDTDGTVVVTSGNDFTLSWTSTNAVSCVASEGWSGDKAVDGSEPTAVSSDTTFTITCENEDGDTAVDSVTADVATGGGGGGGGGSRSSGGGSVLGSTTDQCDYLRDFLRIDFNNDPVEVMKLQAFLIYFEGFDNLEVDGVFDLELENAVDAFQNRYFADVLAPWGHEAPTGYVYLTTRKKVNEIYCQKAFPLTATQQTEVDQFRAFLNSLRSQGIDLGVGGDFGGGLFLPETADAAEVDRGSVLGSIDTTVEISDSENDEEVNGNDVVTTNPRVQEIAASILALPSNASGWGECLFWFVIAIAIIYLVGTIIVNMQDTAGKTDKQVRTRKLLYFIIGTVVAVIAAILLEIFCIVMPLLLVLIILAIGLIWYVNSGNKKN